jgi:NACHT domain/SIR2-like domain
MPAEFPDDLLKALRNPVGALVVVGSGVTISATAAARTASWRGLLESGIERCERDLPLPPGWASRQRENLAVADLDELLSLAGLIETKLGAPSSGEYRQWLRDAFEGLVIADSSVLEALHDLQVTLATTNFDGLLEQVTGRGHLTWRDPSSQRVVRGDDNRVLHFHGYWEDPETVILGSGSYERLSSDTQAQVMRQALAVTRTLIYIGCGEGLQDPSFGTFLAWSRDVLGKSEYRHFRLCLDGEVAAVTRQHPQGERIVPLPYGARYTDLAPFLRRLHETSQGLSVSGRRGQAPAAKAPALEAALRTYRRVMRGQYSRWDLGAALIPAAGPRRSMAAQLDDLYLPLRLGVGVQPRGTDAARSLPPEKLLTLTQPLVIRGPAGSGKTTWMKWTFRRLLDDDDAVPILVLLRNLAESWDRLPTNDPARSLDAFIGRSFEEQIGDETDVWSALKAGWGPKPVLMVDGWDEVGTLGNELREKLLRLLGQHCELRVVATSRPYGVGSPTHSEGFEVLDIQPLSDNEINNLAERFFRSCLGYDGEKPANSAQAFSRSLADLPGARELAQTPLLLTMLLTISLSRPLPDKRHLLFEECVETLLYTAHRRNEKGVPAHPDEWHPPDEEEILRVVAKLAYECSWEFSASSARALQSWDDIVESLPANWRLLQRRGFIKWLCDSVGLLVDSTDGRLSFAHNGLREYLTAWHLNALALDRERRLEFFTWGSSITASGWESLVLWAAMISRVNPVALEPILDRLNTGSRSGLLLAGLIFAEGFGGSAQFSAWLRRAGEISNWESAAAGHDRSHLAAWSRSTHQIRKDEIGRSLATEAATATWLQWARLDQFAKSGGFAPLPPSGGRLAALFTGSLRPELALERSGALERLLAGVEPALPATPSGIGLLHLWPSRRRLAGFRLQLAAVSGFDREMLRSLAYRVFVEDFSSAAAIAKGLHPHEALLRSPHEIGDLAREWAVWEFPGSWTNGRRVDLRLDWIQRFWRHCWRVNVPRQAEWAEWAWVVSRNFPVAEDFGKDLGLPGPLTAVRDFVFLDIATPGRSVARAFLAHYSYWSPSPAATVLTAACKESLHPAENGGCLDLALQEHGVDLHPLWLALSRHLVRQSDAADCTLLTSAARNPEAYEPDLATGLQYIVRGDILLEDGSVVTLDQLADESGIPHLPFLEDMPENLSPDLFADAPPGTS